jgi:hypothetical protein
MYKLSYLKPLSLVLLVILVISSTAVARSNSCRARRQYAPNSTYYSPRGPVRYNYRNPPNRTTHLAVGTAIGAIGGALIGGRKGALVGAGSGAGLGYIVYRNKRDRYERR